MVLDPRLLHRDPESSTAPLLLVSDGCREPGDSSKSQHSSDLRKGKKEVKKKPGDSPLTDVDGGLTHFIKAGEASGHGCMFGGLAQIWSTG